MTRSATSMLVAAPMLLILVARLGATDLKPATAQAWDDYTARAEGRFAIEPRWLDERLGRRDRIRDGAILVEPRAARSPVSVPGGLIHDWIGAVFIPGTSLDRVVDLLRDYDHYSAVFRPTVRASATQSLSDAEDTFLIRYARQALFLTVVLDASYRLEYAQTSLCEWRSTARSTSIREVANADSARERIGSPDDGSGFLWRSETLVDLEERDGGVYLEEETLGLSTTIPFALRWLVEPFVERLAKTLASDWLRQTKEGATGFDLREEQKGPQGTSRRSDLSSGPQSIIGLACGSVASSYSSLWRSDPPRGAKAGSTSFRLARSAQPRPFCAVWLRQTLTETARPTS